MPFLMPVIAISELKSLICIKATGRKILLTEKKYNKFYKCRTDCQKLNRGIQMKMLLQILKFRQ